jgi:hypothetical protein
LRKVFTTKLNKTIENHRIFRNKNFQDRREKIINKNDCLTQKITIQEIEKTVKKLSNGTALGPDNILNNILKIMIKLESFKIVLTKFLKTYLKNQEIPTSWKTSKVYNVFKKENSNLSLNYRPIALLNTTYKIYSTIINNRLQILWKQINSFQICKEDLDKIDLHLQKYEY